MSDKSSAFAWTNDLPSEEGWYWWREKDDSRPEVLLVYRAYGDLVATHNTPTGYYPIAALKGQWCRVTPPERVAELEASNTLHYTHIRRGGLYAFLGVAKVQSAAPITESDAVCVYRGGDGQLWVRPSKEFHDGRFRVVDAAIKD